MLCYYTSWLSASVIWIHGGRESKRIIGKRSELSSVADEGLVYLYVGTRTHFVVLLLYSGRCYEAEIGVIVFRKFQLHSTFQ